MGATRWRRFGKDRLYVRDEGADVGWWDLATDEGHPASPDLESALVEALTAWRAASELTTGDQDAEGPAEAAEHPTPPTPAPTEDFDVAPASPHRTAPVTPDLAPVLALVDGIPGGSAAHEYQRRHDARRERVLTAHPKIGRFLLMCSTIRSRCGHGRWALTVRMCSVTRLRRSRSDAPGAP